MSWEMAAVRTNSVAICAACVVSSLSSSNLAWAQLPDLASVSAQYLPSAPLDDPRGVSAQVASYDASVNLPFPLGPKTFLVPGLNYHVDAVSFANEPADFDQLTDFHSIELAALFVQLLPLDWALSVRIAPGIAGDMTRIDAGLLRLSGLAMATRQMSDEFILGGGILADYGFGILLPLPAVYVDWHPHPALRIESFVPAFVNVVHTPIDGFDWGIRAEFTGNSYAVRDPQVKDDWPCEAQPVDDPVTDANETIRVSSACLDSLAYSVGSVGVTTGLRIVDSLWLNAYGGHTFYRRFEPHNSSGDPLEGPQDLKQRILARLGVTWRLPDY